MKKKFGSSAVEADKKSEERSNDIELKKSSETIFIVEDEEAVRKMTCKVLSEYGYTTIEASNGVEALKTIDKSEEGDKEYK